MHLLLLLLEDLLLALELVLTSLKLCEVDSYLLSLSCLILLHPLKNSNQGRVHLRCRWNRARITGLYIMSAWRHMRNRQVVVIRTITRLAPLLLSLKLLLLSSCYVPDNLVMLSCRLWYIWTTMRLTGCLWHAMPDPLCHVISRKLGGGTSVLCNHLW